MAVRFLDLYDTILVPITFMELKCDVSEKLNESASKLELIAGS